MDKSELIKKYAADNDEKLLLAQIMDKLHIMEDKNVPSFTKFLNEHQKSLAERLLASLGQPKHTYIPDYEDASRTVLVFLPYYLEANQLNEDDNYPVSFIRASFSEVNNLTHRDILGSLMGCGIKRETIGDIFMGSGSCDIVVIKDIVPYLLSNFVTAGRAKLSLSVISQHQMMIPKAEFKQIRDTVASLRLDNIVSSGFSISREKAASVIKAGKVSLEYQECVKVDKAVSEGDIISVRGMGKIELLEIGNITRKGRIAIVIKRYV